MTYTGGFYLAFMSFLKFGIFSLPIQRIKSYFKHSDKFEVTARVRMTSDIIGLLLETFYPATVKTGLGTLRAHGRAVPTVCILKRLP